MQPVVLAVVVLGSALVASWVLMTGLSLRWFRGWESDPAWRRMVLGFFADGNLPLVFGWWFTAIVSTAGWLMGLQAVWADLDTRSASSQAPWDDPTYVQEYLYMLLCAAQLSILLVWTAVVMLVGPSSAPIWRWVCVAILFLVFLVYLATAIVFTTITGMDISHGHFVATCLFLFIHALHGLFWDCVLWGYTYIYYVDYEGLHNKQPHP